MLHARFIARLEDAFPHFYDRANADAIEDAERLLKDTHGDVEAALHRARFEGAGRLWWPYVKGSVPFVGNDAAAMEVLTRLVLTVDAIVGLPPPTMKEARSHVVEVLENSLDVERLRRFVASDKKAEGAAGGGLVAGMMALLAPVSMVKNARAWTRFVPASLLIVMGGVIVAALLSLPIMTGYSVGHQAEARRGARAAHV
jgi:hypothetical protein